MRTITITEQEYKSLGLVNTLSYEILPFNEANFITKFFAFFRLVDGGSYFPFSYVLSYNETIVEESQGYMTPEELDDWTVYPIMDDKIKAKLELI
jgi:hypothetical protein